MDQYPEELSNKYKTNAKYLLLANIGLIGIAIITTSLSWLLGDALLLIPIVVIIFLPYFILIFLQPFNLIYGLYGLIKFKNIKYGLTLFILGILIFGSFIFLKIAQYNKVKEEKVVAADIASSRYEELLNKFSEPQIVISVGANDTLSLQGGFRVLPIVDGVTPAFRVYHEEFQDYAKKNIVGNQVQIRLLTKEEFLKNYSDHRSYNSGEGFFAEVYFKNKLIDLREYD